MSRAVGWRHILPWSAGLIGLFALAHVVLAWVVEGAVIRTGQRNVAARVDVGETRVTRLGGRISLRDVAVANPLAPQRNLIEVERCDIQLEPAALLQKRAVIRNGVVTGLQFGTPRKSSGALPGTDAADNPTQNGWLDAEATRIAQDWLRRLNERFDRDLSTRLQSIQLTNELLERWPQQASALQARARVLRQETADFQSAVHRAEHNPLRHVEFLEQVPDKVAQIRADLTALSRDVENLPNIADDDRRAIVAARQHDERVLRDELKFDRIDTNILSAYLLQEQLDGPLGDLLGWLRWIRRMVPADGNAVAAQAKYRRGRDVLFAGCRPAPELLIRTLQLQGTAQIGDQSFELIGMITDVSDRPSHHDQPMRLRLKSRGSLPLDLQATIDRTGPVARDQLLIDCGGIILPKLRLGGSNKLRLSLVPTTAKLNVSITLVGNKLSGDVQLVQRDVAITPTVDKKLAGLGVEKELEKTLGDVRSLATRISLGGTLDAPQCNVWSNIGPAVAEAMDQALARTANSHASRLLADSRQRVDERLAEFDRQLADHQLALKPQLTESAESLKQIVPDDGPTHRLTVEHLGRRLPADSLFR